MTSAETPLAQIQSAVYQYNDNNWSNTDSGMSVVGLYYNTETGLYRIVGLDSSDNSVTINSALVPTMQYQRASERFHQFTDHLNTVYGLNFASDEEAQSFGGEVEKALALLVQAAETEDPADAERRELEIEAERFAAQKMAEEEEQRKRDEEQKRKEQEEQKRKEADRKKRAEDEKKKKEEDERRKKEDEERKRKEAAERKRKEDEERRRREDEERRRREEEEEERRRQEEEEERRRQEEEAAAEAERQRAAEEEDRKKREREAAAKKAAAVKPAAAKAAAAPSSSPTTGRAAPKTGSLRGNAELDRFKSEVVQAMREELDAWKARLIEEIRNM